MVNYIDDNVGIVNKGSKNVFKGIIRGADYPVITYYYDDIKELDFLNLEEWIYIVRAVN